MEYIKKAPLEAKRTAGVVGKPVFETGTETFITTAKPDMSGGESSIMDYDHTDRAAHWERPQPHDIPEEARNQYEG